MSDAPGFTDDFDGDRLDTRVWVPHYLPQWSSRAESAAVYEVAGSELRLTIPPGHGLWCDGDHEPPLRVSGIQSGVFSGPVGSTVGQQPFKEGAVVREHQPARWGWTPEYGLLEVRARMDLSPRSMAGVWMVGLEDSPERCGEILLFEVFGDALEPGSAAVGMGVRRFRDPDLTGDFEEPRLELDVSRLHVYAAEWRPGRVDFLVDGERVKTVREAPAYPMQMEIALFDFPDKADQAPEPGHVPELAVDHVRGAPLPDNAALVRRSFEAICTWDVDTLVRLYHPDVVLLPLTGTRVESGGYRGHAGVREYMSEAQDLWDVLEPVGEVFTDTGDHVIVTGRCRVRGRTSGAETNPVCAWVVGVQDGLIVSHRACQSYEEALREAGLDPDAG